VTRIIGIVTFTGLMAIVLVLGNGRIEAADLVGLTFFDGKLVDIDPATGLCSNSRTLHYGSQVIRYPVGLTQDPFSGSVYILTAYGSYLGAAVFVVDVSTGEVNPVVWPDVTRVFEGDVDFNPLTGVLYALQDWGATEDRTNLFTIDLTTGDAIVIADLEPGLTDDRDYSAMAFNDEGHLFVLNTALDEIVRINPASGAVISRVALSIPGLTLPSLGNCAAMDFDPGSGQLYLADGCDDGNDALYTVDPGTGVLTEIGPTYLTSGLSAMRFLRSSLIFSDDFESGSTAAWSATMP
jgi:hypothetical protein